MNSSIYSFGAPVDTQRKVYPVTASNLSTTSAVINWNNSSTDFSNPILMYTSVEDKTILQLNKAIKELLKKKICNGIFEISELPSEYKAQATKNLFSIRIMTKSDYSISHIAQEILIRASMVRDRTDSDVYLSSINLENSSIDETQNFRIEVLLLKDIISSSNIYVDPNTGEIVL